MGDAELDGDLDGDEATKAGRGKDRVDAGRGGDDVGDKDAGLGDGDAGLGRDDAGLGDGAGTHWVSGASGSERFGSTLTPFGV
jgi:hypothetical protein